MSTAFIGGYYVDIMGGLPADLRPRVDVWQVAGVDGYGAQTLGLGDAEFDLDLVQYIYGNGSASANNTAADNWIDGVTALQGTVAAITDNWGDTYQDDDDEPSILVLHVNASMPDTKRPVIFKGDASAIRLHATCHCVTAVPAST